MTAEFLSHRSNMTTVISQFEVTLRRCPDKDAVFGAADSASYRELHRRAILVSLVLESLGVSAGDRVGVWMLKSIDQVAAILGVLYANAVLVPIHPNMRVAQVGYIAVDCGVKCLITEASFVAELGGMAAEARLLLGRGPAIGGLDSIAALAPSVGELASRFYRQPEDIAAIIYTSGSTGPPRGIVLSHRNLADGARIVSGYLGTAADDRIAGILAFTFDYGLNQLWQTLYCGASLYLHDFLFPRSLFDFIAEKSITALPLMPALIARLFDSRLPTRDPTQDLMSVRYLSTTGGTITPARIALLRETFPAAQLFLMYGLTEAFRSTYLPPDQVTRRPTSIGKAIPEVEVFVLDEHDSDCPPGVPGQLVHRGSCVAREYWNAPEATARTFRKTARFPGETVVYSGDLVKQDEEGYLYFVARMDSMIKTHGFRVSPTEIEAHVCLLESVADAVAFGVDNIDIGQDIALAYTTQDQSPLLEQDLVHHCRAGLPAHMLPRWFVFVDSFPRLANEGKIDRVRVRRETLEKLAENG